MGPDYIRDSDVTQQFHVTRREGKLCSGGVCIAITGEHQTWPCKVPSALDYGRKINQPLTSPHTLITNQSKQLLH